MRSLLYLYIELGHLAETLLVTLNISDVTKTSSTKEHLLYFCVLSSIIRNYSLYNTVHQYILIIVIAVNLILVR